MKIAVIPGDGIGQEVIPQALRALIEVTTKFDLDLEYTVFDWGADLWLEHGIGLPGDALDTLRSDYQAVLFGALGDSRIPDMIHGREILLGLRRGLDLYVNYRPVQLADRTIEIYRENTQGLYVGVGGSISRLGQIDVAVDECIYTRASVERFLSYCLRTIWDKGYRKVTLVHKANAVPNTGNLWKQVFAEQLKAFPALDGSDEYVDSFCYNFVLHPHRYEAIVSSNLFGDIISDLGAAIMGSLGMAASANLCPETGFGLFEPVHGSAPDIFGKGLANPYATIMCVSLLLEHLGNGPAGAALRECLVAASHTLAATPDMGGEGSTVDFTDEVVERIRRA